MSQSNFFISNDEVRTILLHLLKTNDVLIFNGRFFNNEYPEHINDINEITDLKELTFWLKNDSIMPKGIYISEGELIGKFHFDNYIDPIIEFTNCVWTERLISPGRIFYKAGWIKNERLKDQHIKWALRVSKLFNKGLKKYDLWRISSSVERWVLQGGLLELGKGGRRIGKEDLIQDNNVL